MKRYIFLLIAAVLACPAFADGISTLDQLDAKQSYFIRQGTKGYLYANAGKACTDGMSSATADDAHRWAVVYNEKAGAYFLYNLKDSTFLSTAESACPLVEAATPVYLFDTPQKGTWYAYTAGGVVGLSQNTTGGDILLQGENASVPDALSFEPAGALPEGHTTKIEAAVWLAATQQTIVPVISEIGTRISSLSDLTDGGSYLLYSTGMSKYTYDTGTSLSFNATAPSKNNIAAMPYVFTFHKTGTNWIIETGIEGNYISGISGSAVFSGEEGTPFTITASSTAGSFNLYSTASSQYINAQSAKPVGWGESEGNSRYQLIPVTLAASDKYFPVTYICYETDGEHSRLMDVQTYAKSTNRLSPPTFTGFKRLSTKAADGVSAATSAVTEPTVVYVTYQRSLRSQPVVPTTISAGQFADTTRWYTLQVADRYMQAQSDADGHYMLLNTELQQITDDALWCFVGNNVEGYRLYNRAKGTSLSLTLKDEPVSTDLPFISEGLFEGWAISNGATVGTWYLSPVGAKETVYLADDGQRKLSVMSANAPVVITEASATMQSFAADAGQSQGQDVGQYPASDATLQALTSAANNYTLTEAAFSTLQQAYNTFRDQSQRIGIEGTALYRIISAGGSQAVTAPVEASEPTAAAENTDRDQLWRLIPVGNTGSYYVLNPENGKFLGVASSNTRTVTLIETPGTHAYNISNPSGQLSTWTLKDGGTSGTNSYLNLSEEGAVTGGKSTADGAAWRIVPVKEFVVETQGTGEVAATTVYLPFNATLPAGLTAAAITEKGSESVTIEPLTGNVIPAFTPVILVSGSPQSFVLTATDTPAEAPEQNILVGVEKRIQTANAAETFVMNQEPKFVQGDGTLAAYTAYLDRETTEAAALALVLPTAIQNLQAEGQASASGKWYDLQGRQQSAPTRPGIFIHQGRKVIVR